MWRENLSALAAVGNSYGITMIFLAFAFGCNMGCSVVVSQLFGAKEYGRMKTAVYTAMGSSGILCLMLCVAGLAGSTSLLELIRTPEELMEASRLYLDVYIWGLPFLFFYNIATGIFSALGDSRTPFLFPLPPPPIFLSMCSLLPHSIWEWPEWPGRPSSARESAASWLWQW